MIGRGGAANPALFRELKGGAAPNKEELGDFLLRYAAVLRESGIGEHYTLGRLKELWFYLGALFPGDARGLKRIRKAQTFEDYAEAVDALFRGSGFRADAPFSA